MEQTELRVIIRLEQSGLKSSGEKLGRSERSENITQREKRRAKREEKIIVRRSERRVRNLVQSRAEQSMYCRTTQSEEEIRAEKAD